VTRVGINDCRLVSLPGDSRGPKSHPLLLKDCYELPRNKVPTLLVVGAF
jgi:hypothetical protein